MWMKNWNLFWEGQKTLWERRKCWLPAFSPFHTIFSKDFFYRLVKNRNSVVKSGTLYICWSCLTMYQKTKFQTGPNSKHLQTTKLKVLKLMIFVFDRVDNIVSKRRKRWSPAFSPFPSMFSKGLLLRVVKGGYLDFSHLSESKIVCITEICMKKQYKSSIIQNFKITNKKKIWWCSLKRPVASEVNLRFRSKNEKMNCGNI